MGPVPIRAALAISGIAGVSEGKRWSLVGRAHVSYHLQLALGGGLPAAPMQSGLV
eukprot:CAMPEP_0175775456 /NCGR_PEP_ID=MMETSP0097-20121207/74130_1 /TAXON_ID=311494 /ORGANISM="Alexandrium monilatum, Strain CCMP3105" /LENGTH=54 /DNA_ID=CAMNT_0017085953 /DNA_START=65 /DNA_END=226 /DNA_ORIENTATION=+